ncbi:glycosyltransferase, partial [bacterium]
MPKVSVIMPVYNTELFLGETIESILAQSFSDYEFIIIDDCSTDNSLAVINSYSDPRIRVYQNDYNKGYVWTLNKLIDLSTGQYIARQDSDDISLVNRLEKQIQYLDEHIDIGVCGTNTQIIGLQRRLSTLPLNDAYIRAYMVISTPFSHPTVMMRKSLFDASIFEKYDVSYCPAEDYALWFELSKKTKLANIQDRLLQYRVHENSVTQLKKQIQTENVKTIRKNILAYTLSLDISDDDNNLLASISNQAYFHSTQLRSIETLFSRIIDANRSKRYYPEEVLYNVLFYFWTKVCMRAKDISLLSFLRLYC